VSRISEKTPFQRALRLGTGLARPAAALAALAGSGLVTCAAAFGSPALAAWSAGAFAAAAVLWQAADRSR
jgi:hypothetical protein